MFSVIVPTYNRLSNLKLTLAALEAQINPPEFEIIISDDGSIDGTGEYIANFKANYSFPITYQWCGPNLGFRPHRTRNIGVAQANYPYILLLDSDVMLNPQALYHQQLARKQHPDLVITGMYHWAKAGPLIPEEVLDNFDTVMRLVPDVLASPPNHGMDARMDAFHDSLDPQNIITEYDGLGFYGPNCWPRRLWWEMGGQDELMPNGMGEDAELGQRMRLAKLPVLQYAPVWGVHYHHKRDVARRTRMVQKSIAYIDEKYGIGTFAEATDPETDPREMNLSIWYTRKQKATLVKKENDPTIFALNGTSEHFVGLPEPFWIELLGFTMVDVKIVEPDFFNGKKYEGNIMK